MDKLFLAFLNMSLTGAFVIVAIVLARLPLKKAPKVISYGLWAAAGFRLAIPFSLEGLFSLIPFRSGSVVQDVTTEIALFQGQSPMMAEFSGGAAYIPGGGGAYVPAESQGFPFLTVLSVLWLLGVAVMLGYGLVSYIVLKRKMRTAVRTEGRIYQTDRTQSPFVLGVFKPKIYLPLNLTGLEREYILLHEKTHIRRGDPAVKLISFCILCFHWFNPLAWLAFILMGADMEMSCDERVLKEMGPKLKRAYSLSLLSQTVKRPIAVGGPLAFGEGGVKERVKNVLKYKTPSRVVFIVAVLLAAVLSLGLVFDKAPKTEEADPDTATETEGRTVLREDAQADDQADNEPNPKEPVQNTASYDKPKPSEPPEPEPLPLPEMTFGETVVTKSFTPPPVRTLTEAQVARVRGMSPEQVIETLGTPDWVKPGYSSEIYYYVLEDYREGVVYFLGGNQAGVVFYDPKAIIPDPYRPAQLVDYYPEGENRWDIDSCAFGGGGDEGCYSYGGANYRLHWTRYRLSLRGGPEGERVLFDGDIVWSFFLADLNGDHIPEVCSTVRPDKDREEDIVMVYDFANNVRYELSQPGEYSYVLSLQEEKLAITRTKQGKTRGVEGSLLIYEGKLIAILDEQ